MIVAAFLSCKFVLAQPTYSPYTSIGIGDLNGMGLANNAAMGDVGIASPTLWHINIMNPALLTHNPLTVFEIGVEGENRTVSNELNSVKVGTGGLKYLAFAFPVIPSKWTSSIGLMPYSSVNYSLTVTNDIDGTINDSIITFEGEGGLNQVFFSNGVKLSNDFSLGMRLSYVFGLIEETTTTQLVGGGLNQQFPTGYLGKTNYSSFTYGLGASYAKKLNERHMLHFGATYDFGKGINGTLFERNQYPSATGNVVPGDTLVVDFEDQFDIPSELGVGFSWEKVNKLRLGLDVKRSFWKDDAGFGTDEIVYKSTWALGLGFEITPKYNDVNSYLKRMKYRLGLSFKQMPYSIQGEAVNDFGINFGSSLPIKGVSALSLSFKYGQRGTVSGLLIKEQYFKFVLGATINDRWFVRRKYN